MNEFRSKSYAKPISFEAVEGLSMHVYHRFADFRVHYFRNVVSSDVDVCLVKVQLSELACYSALYVLYELAHSCLLLFTAVYVQKFIQYMNHLSSPTCHGTE